MAVATDGHSDALNESWSKLRAMDSRTVGMDSGCRVDSSTGHLVLKVIDEDYDVDIEGRTISRIGTSTRAMGHHLQILILHYLLGAGNAQIMNRPATYTEFDGGALYYQAFKKRTIDRLVAVFGEKADLLSRVGEAIHAEKVSSGSVGFKVPFFPKLPVTVVLWLGDEEVPASANLLFDASAGRIMATEDLSVLGGELVERLIELAGK